MKRLRLPLMSSLHLTAAALLMGWLAASASAQNSSKGTASTQGVVTDWSSHHVIFSDPGTLVDAMMKGKRAQWERIVNDPRYQMQQLRLGRPMAGQTPGLPRAQQVAPANSNAGGQTANHGKKGSRGNPSNVDWAVQLAPSGSTGGVSDFASPAKYSFTNPSPITVANCRDFVVFPVGNIAGSTTQASLIGFDNIYGVCGTSATTPPPVMFAYTFNGGDGGEVDNSPVLSIEGTKVAFVETLPPGKGVGAYFHVLTLDVAGAPGNGTGFGDAAVPGTGNSASDTGTQFPLTGAGIKSGIYIDYSSDTAYVTDDAGFVHKYNPVFEGTTTEITTSWPINPSGESGLSAPVFDTQSGHLFFIGSSGTLYCYNPDGTTCGSLSLGVQTFVPPIVDGTTGSVFAYGNSNLTTPSPNLLIQASTTNLSQNTQVEMGSLSGNLSRGAFDDAYFTNPASGHLYVGGGDINTTGLPALRRVGFAGGTMTADTTNSFPLQTGSAAGAGIAVTSRASTFDTAGNNCPITGLDTSTGNPNLILVGVSGTNANGFTAPPPTGGLGGATITLLFSNTTGSARQAVWSVTGFTPNTSTSFTINTSGAAGKVCGAVALSGVASVGTVVSANGTSTSPSVTVTSPGSGGVVFGALSVGAGSPTATPDPSQVLLWGPTIAGGGRLGAASVVPSATASTTTMSWTLSGSQAWYLAAVPLIAASAPLQATFTSLLDVFNTSDSTERLFLGVQNLGFTSGTGPSCGDTTCVASFVTTSGAFPTAASSTLTYSGATQLISDIIIDNVSNGGSNIYYGVNNQGIQVSQSALQ